jgi:UDP-N-acetylglucosamine transferase subunit ALG13
MSTFVSVGNSRDPFARLLAAITDIVDELPPPVIVQHGYTPFHDDRCRSVPFLSMKHFASTIAEADTVIVQAGAGSILLSIRAGKVPVVTPRLKQFGEVIDDHQRQLARQFAETGRIVAVDDLGELLAGVREARGRQQSASKPGRSPELIGLIRKCLEQRRARE